MKNLKYIAIALLVLCLMPVSAKAKTICEYEYYVYGQVPFGDTTGFTAKYRAERKYRIKINVGNSSNKDFVSVTYEKFYDNNGTEGDAAKIPDSGNISAENLDALVQKGFKTQKLTFSETNYESLHNGVCPGYAMVTRNGNVCFGSKAADCDTSGLAVNDASSKSVNRDKYEDENATFKGQMDEDTFAKFSETAKKYHDDPQLFADIDFDLEGRDGCAIFGSLTDELASIYNTIRLLMVGALVVFTIVDFTKAMASDKDDALTKPFKHLIIRFVIIIAMFVVPLLIQLLLGIFFGGDWQACLTGF